MKTILLILTAVFTLCVSSYASELYSPAEAQDTTLITDLNSDGVNETITVSFPGSMHNLYGFMYDGSYFLKVGNQTIEAKPDEILGSEISIIDLDKSDNFKELLVTILGSSDFNMFRIYRYDGIMREIGSINWAVNLRTEGNAAMQADKWMGFWTMTENYLYNPATGTIELVKDEFYDVNQPATVKNTFKILKTRNDDGEEAGWLRRDDKITLVKADLTPICNTSDSYNGDDFFCDWYLIKGSDGMEGWIRLKDLQDNVEGLNWAG